MAISFGFNAVLSRLRQRIGERVHHPGNADQHAAGEHDRARPEAIDKVALDRHQPSR
jgi:hypothetical protein